MADYLNIAGRVRTTASDGVAMEAQEVKDINLNKSQQEVNADVQTELGDRYTKEETYSKEQLNNLITTPDVNHVSVVATDATTAVTDILPATGEANTIYRVGNWNGTQYDTTMYALFAWNGSAYVCLAVRSFVGEVYDISVNHPDGQGNPTPYADLAAALGTDGANIPADIRRGGMSIKFIQGNAQSSDNKYVQYRYMGTATTGTPNPFLDEANWQGVDAKPTAGSHNIVESEGVAQAYHDVLQKVDGQAEVVPNSYVQTTAGNLVEYYAYNGRSSSLIIKKMGTSVTVNNATPYVFVWLDDNKYVVERNQSGASWPAGATQLIVTFKDEDNTSGYDNLEIRQGKSLEERFDVKEDILNKSQQVTNDETKYPSCKAIIDYNASLQKWLTIERISGPTSASHINSDGTVSYSDGSNDKTSIYKVEGFSKITINIQLLTGSEYPFALSKLGTFDSQDTIKYVYPSEITSAQTFERVLASEENYLVVYDRAENTLVSAPDFEVLNKEIEVKEDVSNKVQVITNDSSKYPSCAAVVSYVDEHGAESSFQLERYTGPISAAHINQNGTITYNDGTGSKVSIYKIAGLSEIKISILTFAGTAQYPFATSKLGTFDSNDVIKYVYPSQISSVPSTPYTRQLGTDENFLVVYDRGENTEVEANTTDYLNSQIQQISRNVEDIQNGLTQEHICENNAVIGYNKVRYNNSDYSYSEVQYFDNLLYTNLTTLQLKTPATVVIPTNTDNSATSRKLIIKTFYSPSVSPKKEYSLDLVSTDYTLYNLEPNRLYYYFVIKNNTYSSIINKGMFILNGKTRFIKVNGDTSVAQVGSDGVIVNVRDLGGLKTSTNQAIRYGILVRGSQLDNLSEGVITNWVSQEGIDALLDIGINAHLDLREPNTEATGQTPITGAVYSNKRVDQWFFNMNIYYTQTAFVGYMAEAIRQMITWLKDGKKIYFGCYGGADRTGALCTVIEGLCGVTENEINHDYEITSINSGGGRRSRDRDLYSFPSQANNYQSDFKYAMQYIKNLRKYNGVTYVKWGDNYYDAGATVMSYTPVAITDAAVISALSAIVPSSLKEQFKLLMQIGTNGLTDTEIYELESLLVS